MKIGIIGAGQIGGTLTRRLTALGHDVAVANSRGPKSLADLAAETGAKPVSVEEAAKFGDVVVVTIPQKNIPDLPHDLFAETPDSVVIVDTGNYSCSSLTNLDLRALTQAVLMNHGANSLRRRFTVKISTQSVSDLRSPPRAKNENQSGVEPRLMFLSWRKNEATFFHAIHK